MPMRVQCGHCAASYTLPDARLTPGRRLQFLCRQCQQRIVVDVPADAKPAAPAASQSQAMQAVEPLWFVVDGDGAQQRMDAASLKQALANGTLPPQTLVWRKGLAQWQAAIDTAELAEVAKQVERSPTPAYGAGASAEALAPAVMAASAAGEADASAQPSMEMSAQPAMEMSAQASMEMPVIQPPGATSSERRAGLQRRSREQRGDDGRSKWSPATDTWTGPKVTRRVPEEHRQQLIQLAASEDAGARLRTAALVTADEVRATAEQARHELGDELAATRAQLQMWRRFAWVAAGVALLATAAAVGLWLRC
jgi:hypothetical protein